MRIKILENRNLAIGRHVIFDKNPKYVDITKYIFVNEKKFNESENHHIQENFKYFVLNHLYF